MLQRAIYVPALVASCFNAGLQAKYKQLIRTGKRAKIALTAVMRKLVVMANALLRDGRKWSEIPPRLRRILKNRDRDFPAVPPNHPAEGQRNRQPPPRRGAGRLRTLVDIRLSSPGSFDSLTGGSG